MHDLQFRECFRPHVSRSEVFLKAATERTVVFGERSEVDPRVEAVLMVCGKRRRREIRQIFFEGDNSGSGD